MPVLYLGSLFERTEIKGLLALLSLLQDRFAAALVSAAAHPDHVIPLGDVQRTIAFLRDRDSKPLDWCDAVNDIPDLTPEGRVALQRLADALQGFDQNSLPWEVLSALILDRLNLARELAQSSTISAKMQGVAIWQLLNFCRTQPAARGAPVSRLLQRIRRLVLISDDRELRQLPSAAMSMDGVRLMTIHASKGLEFPVIHITGLIKSGLPRANTPPRCLPPDGLIDGSQGLSGTDAVKQGHEQEQECIFFVALSRARDRLVIYASSLMENGNKRNQSPFLDSVMQLLTKAPELPRIAGSAPPPKQVVLQWSMPPQINDRQLGEYENCPRRFFYSHVLKLGGRRAENAFMQMHNALQSVIDWISAEHPTSNPAPVDISAAVEAAWQTSGPTDHTYADDYRRIATELINTLIVARTGQKLLPPKPLTLAFGDSQITVVPNHVVSRPDGTVTVRAVKTGKPRADEFKAPEYTVLLLAARDAYGPNTQVEAVHLTSGTTQQADIAQKSLQARQANTAKTMQAILSGDFPRAPNERRCPRCPHLFHCGALPNGAISAEI